MDYKLLANEIIEMVGGKDNFSSVQHCSTRLRLVLKDDDKVQMEKLEAHEKISGVFENQGQLQLILGPGTVQNVYAELMKRLDLGDISVEEHKAKAKGKLSPLQAFVKTLSDIFVPIIPAIVAGGLLMGINNLLTAPDLFFAGRL